MMAGNDGDDDDDNWGHSDPYDITSASMMAMMMIIIRATQTPMT